MSSYRQNGAFLAKLSLILAMAVMLSACSTTTTSTDGGETAVYDPMENTNRFMLKVNDGIDKVTLEPVARAYRKFTPEAFRVVVLTKRPGRVLSDHRVNLPRPRSHEIMASKEVFDLTNAIKADIYSQTPDRTRAA